MITRIFPRKNKREYGAEVVVDENEIQPYQNQKSKTPIKWRTLIGLVLLYIAVIFELDWMWGVFYLYWILPDLITGETFFIEHLNRQQQPILYWSVVLTLLLLSLYVFIAATIYPVPGGYA